MTCTYIAEYVLPGHPDKLCDAIADALVEEAARREQRALCGVEVAVHRSAVFITGRIACEGAETIEIEEIVRSVYASAGYDDTWRPRPAELKVETDLCLGPLRDGEAQFRGVSDDQSIVTGYAIDLPATNCLPMEHWLAWRLSGALERLRTSRPDLRLGCDGKLMVTTEENDDSCRLVSFSTSLQQEEGGSALELNRAVFELLNIELMLIARAIPGFKPQIPDEVMVNGAGEFSLGGPEGDNGLSGKKLVVDCYGPRVSIGGGALSGKDFYKADRAGAILARRLAKLIVMTGAAQECHATLTFTPGAAEARIISLADGSKPLDPSRWKSLMDFRLATVGDRYGSTGELVDVARHGHFTRRCRAWERIGPL